MNWEPLACGCLVLLISCEEVSDLADPSLWSISPDSGTFHFTSSPGNSSFQLHISNSFDSIHLLDLTPSGPLLSATITEAGFIYLGDQGTESVLFIRPDDDVPQQIVRTGTGYGEFLEPSLLSFYDANLYLYDARLQRILVLTNKGDLVRQVEVPPFMVEQFIPAADGILLVVQDQSHRLYRISHEGEMVDSLLKVPEAQGRIEGPWFPSSGRICHQEDGGIVFLNPWIAELAKLDPVSHQLLWVRRWSAPSLTPEPSRFPGVSPATQRAVLTGMVCLDDIIVAGYFDTTTRRSMWDIFTLEGIFMTRVWVGTASEGNYIPPFIDGGVGKDLVAFSRWPPATVKVITYSQK